MSQVPPADLTQQQRDERLWGMLVHFSSFIGLGIIGPLIVMLVKPFQSEFIHHHAKQQLILAIVTTVVMLISIPLILVIIGVPIMIAMGVLHLIGSIVAAIRAHEGVWYRFPVVGGSS